ncbi:c-type cytochrome [Luteimonas mephitis]|jgi:cytochrome c553|uniref:c-type cytochrome n=1 Tax=Luteimonas mephitis TaxID=83615 RepID=UPI0004010871|nr:c-type cytochrome [Luteimonas mephitis]
MTRLPRLLAFIAACTISALAIAQSQDPPATAEAAEAVETPAPQAEQDAPAADPAGESTGKPSSKPYVDLRRAKPIAGNAAAGQAKSELCAACHGPQGISPVPTFPNLAGQRADFLYWQLVEFKRNPDSPMSPLVAELSNQDMLDFAAYYAGLAPTATPAEPDADVEAEAAPADATLARRGEQIYMSGDPSRGIPPCQGCHGPDAGGHVNALHADRDGHAPYAAYPALRGQQAIYLQTKLAEYRNGKMRDSTTDFVMTGVGERLDDDSIDALSAWLSSLPPGP